MVSAPRSGRGGRGFKSPLPDSPQAQPCPFPARIRDLLDFLVPGYVSAGRHYLTIAVGCTGGHHRSVVIADEIARVLQEKGYPSTVVHRDVEKE